MKVRGIQNMPPVYVRLFHSRKKLQRMLDRDEFRFELSGSSAQTVAFEKGGTAACAVLLEHDDDSAQTIALLVHEAVHVAQAYWESIGEDSPSSEFMAYTVQEIAQYLMEEHAEWRERKGLR